MKVPTKPDERLVTAVAMLALGVVEAPTAAAFAGLTEESFLEACADPEVLHRAEAERLKLKLTGKSAELRAALALDTLTDQLAERVETDHEMPTSTVVRVGEFLLRTSGLEQTRGADLKAATPNGNFVFAVVRDGEPAPELPDGTAFGLIINLDGQKPRRVTHDD